jgi:hypothetical protein
MAKTTKVKLPPAEHKYIGDDGGRWIFQRRSDGLIFTIDKPRGDVLNEKTPPFSVQVKVRGKQLREELFDMVRK